MKNLYRFLAGITMLLLFTTTTGFAQNAEAKKLVDEGIKLHDDGKYAEAILKYQDALSIEPDYKDAQYEIAYSYNSMAAHKKAIPILEKLVSQGGTKMGRYYDLLGTSYDDDKQPEKALAAYNAGIKNQPDYQRLYFNLGITNYRLKKYAEAEKNAIEAIRLQPSHASSHKLYADVNYDQNKKLPALLGYCSFLLLEPNKERSGKALNLIDSIFDASIAKETAKPTNSSLQLSMAEMSINMAVSAKKELEKKDASDPIGLLEFQLKMIFNATGKASANVPAPKDFFWKNFADYFYSLAQSDNMQAFAHYITLYRYNEDSVKWFNNNETKLKSFSEWVDANPRKY